MLATSPDHDVDIEVQVDQNHEGDHRCKVITYIDKRLCHQVRKDEQKSEQKAVDSNYHRDVMMGTHP